MCILEGCPVQIRRECHIICRSDMPHSVLFHHEREVLDMVIYIPSHDIKNHPSEELRLLVRRYAQFPADLEHIFIAVRIRIHCRKCLRVDFPTSCPVIPRGKEMAFTVNPEQPRGHHGDAGFLRHPVICHFHLSEREVIAFGKLQNIICISFRKRYLS